MPSASKVHKVRGVLRTMFVGSSAAVNKAPAGSTDLIDFMNFMDFIGFANKKRVSVKTPFFYLQMVIIVGLPIQHQV